MAWRTRIAALLAALAAVALIAVGCGDDDDDGNGNGGGGGDGGVSKAEYIAEVDAICKRGEEELDALPEPSSLDELASQADEAKGLFEDALADIRAVEKPDDQAFADDVDAYLADIEATSGRFDELKEAAEAGDEAAVRQIGEEAEAAQEDTDRQARELGFKECSD
jgi:hypothetical protein